MEYRQHQLENGLTVIAECNPRAYVSAFGYFVRTGARDESPEIGGVSHFLEHMVFKGTQHRTAEQVNRELDEMGSASNARTSEESTIYHSAVLPEFQSPMVELLSDLMRPAFRDEDFETEKQVIIEEILMYEDQPPYGANEKIMADFFGNHPLGQSVLGTTETVGALTPEMMKQYFEQRYSPGNMALAASGNIDFDLLVEDATRCCGQWKSFDTRRNVRTGAGQSGFCSMHKPQSHQQYILQLAPGPASSDPQRYANRVAATILGDDSGSRMYWDFIDPGFAESAGMASHEYVDQGLTMTFLCCPPENAQENLNRLADLQQVAVDRGVTQRELDLAKSKISSHIVLSSERTENRMFSVGAQWLIDQPFNTVAEIARLYESVTLDQVNAAIQQFPPGVNMTMVVGPNDQLENPYA